MTPQTVTRPASLTEWQARTQLMKPLLAESLERGLTYQPQPSDLFISPFAKCGISWLMQIVHGLRTRGGMNVDEDRQIMPWLEMAHDMGIDLDSPQPGGFRMFKSHLSWTQIPKGGRYIVSFRNPKDALVSFYHFVNGYWWQTNSVSMTEFATAFYLNYQAENWAGSYWGHLVSWWQQRHHPQVLLLTYEAIQADLPTTVETIAHFLGLELDQDVLNLVLKQASFKAMPTQPSKVSEPLHREACAKQSDHRSQLPAEIGAAMDAIWQETVAPKTGLTSYQALAEALA